MYFLVEETRELSLENLHDVFSVPKGDFVRLKARRLLWLARRYLLLDKRARDPSAVQEDDDESPSFDLGRYDLSAERGAGDDGLAWSRPGSVVDSQASVGSVHRGGRER